AGLDVAPWVDFSTGVNTVDPATFGIPGAINTAFDRPNLQLGINTLLGRVGNVSQGFVQRGSSYAPGGTTFLFKAWFPELDFYAQDTWKAARNLTVDAGLRWELKMHPTNPDGLIRVPNQRVAGDVDEQHPHRRSGIPVANHARVGHQLSARAVEADAAGGRLCRTARAASVRRLQRQPGRVPQQRLPRRVQRRQGGRRERAAEH